MSALGPKAERRLRSIWTDLEATQEVFVIWTKSKNDGRLIFVEVEDHFIPEEADEIVSAAFAELLAARADIILPQEAVIRLFTNEDEAGFYMETVGAFLGIEPPEIEIVKMNIADLFRVRDALASRSREATGFGLRLDLSRARVEEWVPDTIDTLWSSERPGH